MASNLSRFLALASAIPVIHAAAPTTPRDADAGTGQGFISFPIKRGGSTKTLSGRQATASLVNEADTSYLIELTFGSNAQAVKVAIDTGSDELFVDPDCEDPDFTSDEQQECDADGTYTPSTSTTSKTTGETSQIVYGSGAVDIAYYIDSIGIPGASQNLTSVQFGKATESEDLNEGILGLGFGNGVNLNYSNFVDALQEQGLTNTKAFSVALGTSDTAGGTIVFGGVDTKKFAGSLTSLDIASPEDGDIQRYAVAMSSLSYKSSSGTTKYSGSSLSEIVLDTGSSLCELPSAIVTAMANDVGAQEDSESGLYVVDCNAASSSDALEFAFDGVTINVPMSDFVLQDGTACVLGVMALESGTGIDGLLGDTFLRNAYVVFDQTNMKISMAQYTSCGTNVQAIATGSAGASSFTGECAATSTSTSNDSGAGDVNRPAGAAVLALVGGLAALVGLL
ncbi:acid protease [Cryphonectria parasitica EP155]|uniref:Acid protease n=1 Tax=Cryphonectria parasitica (strain ATCC 38755 / EP155) TaxID=660469 RepID=A0A9P4Y254_CRYP1|nr:acid protease [Cryphonectria parasitica EP155]KAF3765055.1 acid protease [Cryphonectria parasitica EP155]